MSAQVKDVAARLVNLLHRTWFDATNGRIGGKVAGMTAVELIMEGRRRQMRARVASAEEKAALWPEVVAAYRGYAQYQARTERDIPLVILEERPANAPEKKGERP